MDERLLTRAREAAVRARELAAESEALIDANRPCRCAWCWKYRIAGRWRVEADVPTYFKARRNPDSVTHGICPDCFEELRASGRSR